MAEGYQDIQHELNRFALISAQYRPRASKSSKKRLKTTSYDSLLIQLNGAILEGTEGSLLSPEMNALARNIRALNTTRQQLLDFVSQPQPLYELIDPLVEAGEHQNDWTQKQWEEEALKIQSMLDLLQEKPSESFDGSDSAPSPFVFIVSKIKGVLEKSLPDSGDSHKLLSEEQRKTILAKKERKAAALAMLDRLELKKGILGELPKKSTVIKTIPPLRPWDRFLKFFRIETRKTKARKHLLGEIRRMSQLAKERARDLALVEIQTRQAVVAEMQESISRLEKVRNAARDNARSILEAKKSIATMKKQSLTLIESLDRKAFEKISAEVGNVLSLARNDMEKSLAEIQKIQRLRAETSKIESENDGMQADIASSIAAIKEENGVSTESWMDEQIDALLNTNLISDEEQNETSIVEREYSALMTDLQNWTRIRDVQEKSLKEAFIRVAALRTKIETISPEIILSNREEAVRNAVALGQAVESAERVYMRSMKRLSEVNAVMVQISERAAKLVTASKEKLLSEHIENLEKSTQHNELSLKILEQDRAQIFSRLAEANTQMGEVPAVEDLYYENEIFKAWVEKSGFTQKVDAIFDAQKRSAEKSCDLQEKIRDLRLEAIRLQEEIRTSLALSWKEYMSGLYQEHFKGEKPENITVDLKIARVQECIDKQAYFAKKLAEHRAKNEILAKKVQEIEVLQQELVEEFGQAKKAKDELAVLLSQSERFVVQAENQKRSSDAMVSAAVEAIAHIDTLDTTKEESSTMIPNVLSSGLSQVYGAVSLLFDKNPVVNEQHLAHQEANEAKKASVDIHKKFDGIDALVDEIVTFQQQGAAAFEQGIKVQKWQHLMNKASDVLATLRENEGNYEWALIQAIVPAVMVMQRAVNQNIQKMCENSDLSVIQRALFKIDSLSIVELQTLKDRMLKMKSDVSQESIEKVQEYLQSQQFSGSDIHILERERAWLSANIKLYGTSGAILSTEEDRCKAVHAMEQIDEIIAMHKAASEIIAVAVNLESSLEMVACKLQELSANTSEAKVSLKSSPVLKRHPFGIWTEEKNHSALFQPAIETTPEPNKQSLVHRTLRGVKVAIGALVVFATDISTWFGVLIESGGVGLL